jgi:hypothetical protein
LKRNNQIAELLIRTNVITQEGESENWQRLVVNIKDIIAKEERKCCKDCFTGLFSRPVFNNAIDLIFVT